MLGAQTGKAIRFGGIYETNTDHIGYMMHKNRISPTDIIDILLMDRLI